jgi:hypothetical protein
MLLCSFIDTYRIETAHCMIKMHLNKIFIFVLYIYFVTFFGVISLVRASSFSMLKKSLEMELISLTWSWRKSSFAHVRTIANCLLIAFCVLLRTSMKDAVVISLQLAHRRCVIWRQLEDLQYENYNSPLSAMIGGQLLFFLEDFEIQLNLISVGLSDMHSFICFVPSLEISPYSTIQY